MVLKRALRTQTPRRSRRVAMRWPARYIAHFDDGWLDCDVLDLSLDGAAREMASPPHEPEGDLVLELESDGQPTGTRLRATVRYWESAGAGDRLRVGIEFVGMTNLERYTLANIVSRHRRAASTP